MSEEVLVDVADGIMTVTINRPDAKNAVNKAVAEGIGAAMEELDSNDDIRVAILRANGPIRVAVRHGDLPAIHFIPHDFDIIFRKGKTVVGKLFGRGVHAGSSQ